jgi:RimJ/RimL family protein N-acetyltransferase
MRRHAASVRVRDRLLSERLVLRRPVPTDDEACFRIHGDPRAATYRTLGPDASIDVSRVTLARWIAHWDEHGFGPWLVEHEGELAGFGGLRWRGADEIPGLNLYFRIRPELWGRGLGTELARASVRIAFHDGLAPEVTAVIRPDNAPSIRVVERIGMRLVRDVDFHGQRAVLYAIAAPRV